MKSAPAIAFDYRASRALLGAVVAVLLLALGGILNSGFDGAWKLALIVATCVYAGFSLDVLRRCPVTRCAWHAGGQWRLRDRHGEEHSAVLLHSATRGPLIALVLRAGALRRVNLVLLPDNCDAETRRQLRVRLGRGEENADGAV